MTTYSKTMVSFFSNWILEKITLELKCLKFNFTTLFEDNAIQLYLFLKFFQIMFSVLIFKCSFITSVKYVSADENHFNFIS